MPDELHVANEFAEVVLRKVRTRQGERIEISSPRRGFSIELDAVALESLTWQNSEVFSAFLSGSVGPPGGGH